MVWAAIIPIAIVVLIIIMIFYYYNSFVTLQQRIKNSKSQITVQLKKRTDLVPNLVKMVKGYMKHEKDVLTQVTKARTNIMKASGFEVNGNIIDTMVVAALLDENRFSYSLNAVAYDHINKTKSERALVEAAKEFGFDPKGEMWRMPANFVGEYAEQDAVLTLELWKFFKVQI